MIPREVLKSIRRIQIRTSHRVDELLAGSWHSAFKGRGMEFEEVRPYTVGDDVRAIDWNVTARSDQPYIKLFREERELSVMLLVDLSGSVQVGTTDQTKRQLVTEVGATLAMSAIKNNDRVGLTLFTDQIEKSIPPSKGSRHVLRLIRELLYCQPVGTGTRLAGALEHLNRTQKRRVVVFLISDFIDSHGFERPLRLAARRHDIVPIIVNDPSEEALPDVGLIRVRDSESGQSVVIDTSSRRARSQYQQMAASQREQRDRLLARNKLRPLYLKTGQDCVEPLRRYFHQREAGR